jgi:hypothetical protein
VYTVMGIKDGLCFLRTIISKDQLDTMGTIEMLRSSLGILPTKIVEVAGNIVEFHQHVNTLLNALDSYGQAYPERIVNLFKAYKLIEDKEFSTFIMITQYGYIANPIGYNPRTLVEGVENDYIIRVETGTWAANIEKKESTEIAALRAEINHLRQGTNNNANTNNGNTWTGNGNGGAAAQRRREKNVWKKIPPTEGASKSTVFEGCTYHWCGNHQIWTMHKEEECKGIWFPPNGGSSNNNTPATNNAPAHPQAMSVILNNALSTNGPSVWVAEAMQALVEYSGVFDDWLSCLLVRIGKLLLHLYFNTIKMVASSANIMFMVTIIAIWTSLSVGIIIYEHLINCKGSILLYSMLGTISNIISFGRKPKFKRKLNLKITSYRKNKQLRGLSANGVYINWINAMSTYIGVKSVRVPNANQLDQYAVAMSNVIRFDSDSSPIKIDNCCTQTISGFQKDFIPSTLQNVSNLHVNGFGNTRTAISQKGTVKWVVIDDSGQHRDIIIPNTYFVPGCGIRLLSPQHWDQEVKDNFPTKDGTWCATFNDRVLLEWNQRQHKKTIQINPEKSNVAVMWTVDGSSRYNKFASMIKYAMDSTIWQNEDHISNEITSDESDDNTWDMINNVSRNEDSTLRILGEDKRITHDLNSHSLLEWHIRLGHMSFKRIQALAKIGKYQKSLQHVKYQYVLVASMDV